MKIVATSDTHFPFDNRKIPDGDVFIHAGDLMYTGFPDEWAPCIESFKGLKHSRKFFVPGNHDYHVQLYPGSCHHALSNIGVNMIESAEWGLTRVLPNKMTLLGLPWITGLPGWAFNKSEEELYDLVKTLPRADIVVSHSPPVGIADGKNWGVRAWRMYQLIHKPAIWICGHVHECYGEHAFNGTLLYNVAMCNVNYEQVNPPMVINV